MCDVTELDDLMLIDLWHKVVVEIQQRLLEMDRLKYNMKEMLKKQPD